MTRTRIDHLALAFAVAGATLGAPAAAQDATASASLSGFTYQLIDLDAADGVTPEVSFFNQIFHAEADHSSRPGYRQTISQAGSVAIDSGSGQAGAIVSADAASVQLRYSSAPGIGTVSAASEREISFTLSPNTGILFSALANVDIARDAPITGWSGASIYGWVDQGNNLDSTIYFSDLFAPKSGPLAYHLSAFGYAGQYGGTGRVEFSASANVFHYNPAPVPEPAGAAMLLAGLGLIGAAAARRRMR